MTTGGSARGDRTRRRLGVGLLAGTVALLPAVGPDVAHWLASLNDQGQSRSVDDPPPPLKLAPAPSLPVVPSKKPSIAAQSGPLSEGEAYGSCVSVTAFAHDGDVVFTATLRPVLDRNGYNGRGKIDLDVSPRHERWGRLIASVEGKPLDSAAQSLSLSRTLDWPSDLSGTKHTLDLEWFDEREEHVAGVHIDVEVSPTRLFEGLANTSGKSPRVIGGPACVIG